MHLHHSREIAHLHVVEAFVAQDAGIVDEDVAAAPTLAHLIDQRLGAVLAGNIIHIGDGFAARRGNFVDHLLRRARVAAGAVDGAANVINRDLGAARG